MLSNGAFHLVVLGSTPTRFQQLIPARKGGILGTNSLGARVPVLTEKSTLRSRSQGEAAGITPKLTWRKQLGCARLYQWPSHSRRTGRPSSETRLLTGMRCYMVIENIDRLP